MIYFHFSTIRKNMTYKIKSYDYYIETETLRGRNLQKKIETGICRGKVLKTRYLLFGDVMFFFKSFFFPPFFKVWPEILNPCI